RERLSAGIEEVSEVIEQEAVQRPEVKRLMTPPGVGALTALAFVLIIGSPERFRGGKQIGSYLGLVPCEDSSADRQRLGHISKQGNMLLRFLLVEAAQAVVRWGPEWRGRFLRLWGRWGRRILHVAGWSGLGGCLYMVGLSMH